VGITVLSVLGFISVAQYAVLAVLALVNPPAVAALLHALSPGGSGPEVQLRLGAFLPVYYLVSMGLTSFVAYGFWKLRNWTRVVILVLIAVSLVAGLATAPSVMHSGSAGALLLWLVRIGLCLGFGWYLMSGRVRTAFRGVQSGLRP
jgi:hypothetical protein